MSSFLCRNRSRTPGGVGGTVVGPLHRSLLASHYDCDDDDRSLPAPFMFGFLPPTVRPSGEVLFSFASRPPSLPSSLPSARHTARTADLARKLWKAALHERKGGRGRSVVLPPSLHLSIRPMRVHAEVTTVNNIDCILSNLSTCRFVRGSIGLVIRDF